jgi:hypothetical protein
MLVCRLAISGERLALHWKRQVRRDGVNCPDKFQTARDPRMNQSVPVWILQAANRRGGARFWNEQLLSQVNKALTT